MHLFNQKEKGCSVHEPCEPRPQSLMKDQSQITLLLSPQNRLARWLVALTVHEFEVPFRILTTADG